MEKLIKITNENYPDLFDKNMDKFLFVNANEEIIGVAMIDDNVSYNKIRINIKEKFRSNGYGKTLFQKTTEEYKKTYTDKKLRFEIGNDNRFNSILYKSGAINISNNNGKLIFILPIE
jgi:predicted GNAT family N-acyltransferase